MIRILLANDEELIRAGLRCLLKLVDDLEVVAEAVDTCKIVRGIPITRSVVVHEIAFAVQRHQERPG